MIKKLTMAVMATLALVLGLASPAGARVEGPDVTYTQHNVVQNSGFSNSAILVSGVNVNRQPIQPEIVPPRWSSRSTGYYLPNINEPIWNPEAFTVAPGAEVLYRLTTPRNGGAFAWQSAYGGASGSVVSVGNMFRFFGCTPGIDACTVQVIHVK